VDSFTTCECATGFISRNDTRNNTIPENGKNDFFDKTTLMIEFLLMDKFMAFF
jgi:hypothetical protein